MECWACEYLSPRHRPIYENYDFKIMCGLGEHSWGYYGIWKKHTSNVSREEKRDLIEALKYFGDDWENGEFHLTKKKLGIGHYHLIVLPNEE